jgi:hypothetical protein
MNENIIEFSIDEKSLNYGITNDYSEGNTSTVSTPLNQSKNPVLWKNNILSLSRFKCRYNKNIPNELLHKCLNMSKALDTSVSDLFVFNNLLLDGKKLECNYQFCFYFKKENSDFTNNGKINTHKGRIKLHYQKSMFYKDQNFNIDNKKVLESILIQNGGFAFLVRKFEYNKIDNSLNFITSIVGPAGMPQSAVFSRKKGVGKKYVHFDYNPEAIDYLISIEQSFLNDEDALISIKKANITREKNGQLGEKKVIEYLKSELLIKEKDIYHISEEHAFSPYDIEYTLNSKTYYVEVKSTQSNKINFYLSPGEMKFMEKNKENYYLFLVTNVRDINPTIKKFTYNDIKKMKSQPTSARFYS